MAMDDHTGTSPGSVHFDPFSDEFFSDPFETYRQLRDRAPVYYSTQYDFWALSAMRMSRAQCVITKSIPPQRV